MSRARRAYSSTVVAPGHVVAAAVIASALCTLPRLIGAPPWPVTFGIAALVVLAGIHLATVRVTISAGHVRIGQGPWHRPGRVIPIAAITDAHAVDLNQAQIFGIGVPFHWDVTRLTIRPGPTLVMVLDTGEHIRVSTADPDAAAALINAARGTPAPAAPEPLREENRDR